MIATIVSILIALIACVLAVLALVGIWKAMRYPPGDPRSPDYPVTWIIKPRKGKR